MTGSTCDEWAIKSFETKLKSKTIYTVNVTIPKGDSRVVNYIDGRKVDLIPRGVVLNERWGLWEKGIGDVWLFWIECYYGSRSRNIEALTWRTRAGYWINSVTDFAVWEQGWIVEIKVICCNRAESRGVGERCIQGRDTSLCYTNWVDRTIACFEGYVCQENYS